MPDAVRLAREALERGDFIAAYDIAASAAAEEGASDSVRHLQLLALARMGSTQHAMELFDAYGFDDAPDADHRALRPRLLKDLALQLPPGEERRTALETAYRAYHGVYLEGGSYYQAINAATLALLAGLDDRAHALAAAVLDDQALAAAGYYPAATKAEALLVLGRVNDADEVLRSSAIRSARSHGDRAGTARQLAMIAEHLGLSGEERRALLAPLAPPRCAHVCGHMFAADQEAEERLSEAIGAALDEEQVGFVYGSLAAGADLLFAEAAQQRGLEFHAVLPFDEEDFLAQSVRPGGEGWVARYAACRDSAARLVPASEMEYFGDPSQYGYASRMAMGLARLRAEHLGGEAVQIAVWDSVPATGPAGTGADVAAWTGEGLRSRIIEPGPVERKLERPPPRVPGGYERDLAAILFTDFAGFSTLKEAALPAFWDGVMREVAAVLDRHGSKVVCRNSWGDALYAVADSAEVAAEIALELQDSLARFDYSLLGLDAGAGGMRIGAHYGPAYRTTDHITGRTTFYGTEVSKAARIEPVTPPGAVFVTEPFAAILTLEARDRFQCAYVGRIPLAKKYGDYRMYRLMRAQ